MKHGRKIRIASLISYSTVVFSILTGLLYTPWMIKQIGASKYGIYVVATSFLAYFIQDLGLSGTLSRFIVKFRVEGKKDETPVLLGATLNIYLLIDAVILALVIASYILLGTIFQQWSEEQLDILRAIFLIVGAYSIGFYPLKLLDGIMIGYGEFVPFEFCNFLNKFLNVVFIVIALVCGGDVFALVYASIFSAVITSGIKLAIVFVKHKVRINLRFWNGKFYRSICSFIGWNAISIGLNMALTALQITIVGALASAAEVTYFSIGFTIFNYIYTISVAINRNMFFQQVGILEQKADSREKLMTLAVRVGRLQLLINGCIIIIFAAAGKEFMQLWMGEAYTVSYYVAVLMILPLLIYSAQTVFTAMVEYEAKLRYETISLALGAAVSIVLSVPLTKLWGAPGAAFGSCCGLLVARVFLLNYFYWKKMNMAMGHFFAQCHLKFAPVLLAVVGVGVFSEHFMHINLWFHLILKCTGLFVLYVLLCWLFFLNPAEKEEGKAALRKMNIFKISWSSIRYVVKKSANAIFPLRYLYHLPSDLRYMRNWHEKKACLEANYQVKCFSNLSVFCDKHKGQRCFIIGNGPSLDARDLDKLKNEISFASNGIYGIYGMTGWRPTYFCTGDPRFPIHVKDDIRLLLKDCECAFFNFMNLDLYAEHTPAVLETDKAYFYYHAPKPGSSIISDDVFRKGRPRFGDDLKKKIYSMGTISYEMLQIAVYMGFSEIYLLGMDHYMPLTGKTHFDGDASEAIQFAVDCTTWTKAYESALKYAQKNGIKISNATRGGYLEVFPRVDFDTLFPAESYEM